jgi:diadenosine tetraphosphate (Ap4A) HIT family hydrolase
MAVAICDKTTALSCRMSRLKVDHVHYHLIPRSLHDELYLKVEKFETDIFRDMTLGDIEASARIL